MTVKLKITTKWTMKMLKLGMVSSFHPHSLCERVDKGTAKTGCTSCTNWTISFEVSGFHTETRVLQKGFHFFELIWTPYFFCVQNAPFKATSSIFNPFRLHLFFFMHLLIFSAIRPWNWKALQMNSEKVKSWHGIIISPT